jgi:ABC-type glycerol-3-phosphate transport system substrate-binding protein
MKKIFSLLLSACFLLTSCGTNAPAPATSAAATATRRATQTPDATPTRAALTNIKVAESALKGVEISVWHPWYGVESSLFDSLVKDFNKTNKWGIKVNAQSQGNFANLFENVTAALPKKEKPDLAVALPEHALAWDADGVVTDLALYAEDPLYGMDAGDIPPIFWDQDRAGKKRIAIPAQRNARFLLWNKTWAKELGFDSSPDTPDDFKQQACRAQQAMLTDASPQNDFKGGWLVDTSPMTAYAWLLAFNGGVLEGGDYRFLTPQNIEAFKFLREVAEEGCSWQAVNTDPSAAFAAREALFIAAGLEDLPEIARGFASANSRDQWEVIAFPGADQDAFVVYGSSYVILDSSAEKKFAAWLFVRWLLENQQDARFVEATHLFPIRASTLNMLGDYKKTHPQWAQAVELLPQGIMQPQLASWDQVKIMLGDGFAHTYRVNIPSGQVAAILAEMESTARELGK